jgi:uncharacterized coiled-coil protein SlyX
LFSFLINNLEIIYFNSSERMVYVDIKKSDLFDICKLHDLDVNDQTIKDIFHLVEKEGNIKFKHTFRISLIQDVRNKILKLILTWRRLNENEKFLFLSVISNRFYRFVIEPSDIFKESSCDYINNELKFNKDRLKLNFEECLILNRKIGILQSRIESLNEQFEQKETELRLNSTKLDLLQKKLDSVNKEVDDVFSDKLNEHSCSNVPFLNETNLQSIKNSFTSIDVNKKQTILSQNLINQSGNNKFFDLALSSLKGKNYSQSTS